MIVHDCTDTAGQPMALCLQIMPALLKAQYHFQHRLSTSIQLSKIKVIFNITQSSCLYQWCKCYLFYENVCSRNLLLSELCHISNANIIQLLCNYLQWPLLSVHKNGLDEL